MQIRLVFVGAALLGVMAGCRSTPWETVANSKFGIDRFAWFGRQSRSDDAEPAKSENRDGDSLPNSSRLAETRGGLNRGPGLSAVSGHLQSGYQAEGASRWNQAKMFYRRVLDVEPGNPLAHHRLAIIADKQGEFQKAEELYLTALRANRNDPHLLSDLGYSFLLQNRQEESEVYLRRALRADPSHSRASNNLGLLYSRRGDYDGALAMFRLTGPEHQALEKMRELFPSGRPLRNETPGRPSQSFVQSSAPKNEFASVEYQQRSTPAIQTVTPIIPYPRRQFDSNRGMQSLGGPPVAPSPRRNRDPSGANDGFARPPAGAATVFASGSAASNTGSTVPLDAASQSRRTMPRSLPEIFDRQRNSVGAGGLVPPPADRDSRNTEPFDRQQPPVDPLKAVPQWPRQRGTQIENRPDSHSDSHTSAPARNIAPSPRGEAFRPTAQQSPPAAARGIEANSLFKQADNSAGPPHSRADSRPDDRRQAAMLGLNAGADGIFPMIPENNYRISQVNPEINPQTVRPAAVRPQTIPRPPSNIQRGLIPTDPQPSPTSGTRAVDRVREPNAAPPANMGTNSYRAAARPLSRPTGVTHSYSNLR